MPGLDYDLTPLRALGVLAAVAVAFAWPLLMAAVVRPARVLEHADRQRVDAVVGAGLVRQRLGRPAGADAEWLQDAGRVLPFWYTLGFPVELLSAGSTAARSRVAASRSGVGWRLRVRRLSPVGWRAGVRRFQAVAG